MNRSRNARARALKRGGLLLMLLLAVAGCGTGETEPPGAAAPNTRVQTTVTVVVPTAPVESAPATAETVAGETAEVETPAATAPPSPAQPPAEGLERAAQLPGVVYRTEDALYQLDGSGEPRPLSTISALILSPTGGQGLYLADGDVWLVDLGSGEERNVTAGSGRTHVSARWWPSRPETLVLTSWGEGEQGPNSGRLTLVAVDGSNYRVAHPEGALSFAAPAPGPDGQTIAYDEAGSPWLYRLDGAGGSAEPFSPATYLPRDVEVARGASPSWSPDGSSLAWIMGLTGPDYGNEQGWDVALTIFDLDARAATIIHPFMPVGRGGWFPAAQWSPDGEWLLYSVETPGADERGLWVTPAAGGEATRLHPAANVPAFWSPPGAEPWQNGAYLLLGGAEDGFRLVARGSWEATPVTPPAGASIVDWRSPEAE